MMSNSAGGGNVLVPSGIPGQSVLMSRSSLAGAGVIGSSASGGGYYLAGGGNMPQYMMGYPGMSAAGLPMSGTAGYMAAAHGGGNPYALQMSSAPASMYG